MIDCGEKTSDFERCKQEYNGNEDVFPIITVFIPPELKFNPYTKKFNKHYEKSYDKKEYSENLIYNFITSNIPNKGVKLNTDNIDGFLTNPEFNKLILFTDKKQSPLIYRGLSNYFYNQILFGEVEKEEENLIRKFNVKSFPTLMIYKTQEEYEDLLDEPIIEFYKGKIDAKDIVNFISDYSLKEKKYLEKSSTSQGINMNYYQSIKEIKYEDINTGFFEKNRYKRIVLYLYSESNLTNTHSEKSIEKQNEIIPEILRKFYYNTNGFFYFYKQNCFENLEFCKSNFRIKEFPSLILINKNLDKIQKFDLKKFLENIDNLPFDYDEITSKILKLYPSEIKFVNPQNYQFSLQSSIMAQKTPILYFFDDIIPLGLHLISTEIKLRDYIDLFGYETPPKEILKSMQINKLPELTIVINDPSNPGSARLMKYQYEINYTKLKKFFTTNFDLAKTVPKNQDKQENIQSEIELIDNNQLLENLCLKTNKKLCLLSFFDAKENDLSQKSFENSMKIYREFLSKNLNKPYNFGWVNATCQHSFSSLFNIDSASLPNIMAYIPSRDVFATLVGTYDIENIDLFIERVIKGKAHFSKIDKEKLKLPDIKCHLIQEITENLEDDEILKEILEEERKKREEIEKQRESEEQIQGKKKGKKKKKKKDL